MTKEKKKMKELIARRKEELERIKTDITNELYDSIERAVAQEYDLEGYDVIRVSIERSRIKLDIKNNSIFNKSYPHILPKGIKKVVDSLMADLGYEEEPESNLDTCLGQILVYVLK